MIPMEGSKSCFELRIHRKIAGSRLGLTSQNQKTKTQIKMNFPTTAYDIALLAATLLCTTVFAVVLVFNIVVMPGIAKFDDHKFLQAFQFIDGIIQNNEPTFTTFWMGSIAALLVVLIFNIVREDRDVWVFVAAGLYGIGQVMTFTINIPRNNRVKMLDIVSLSIEEAKTERLYFERVWNQTNLARTVLFGVSSIIVALLLHSSGVSD